MRLRLPRPDALEGIAIVMALLVVATFVAPGYFRPRGDPRATARADIDALGAALETYRYDAGRYPSTEQGLAALVRAPASSPRPWSWRGPYLLRPAPHDPWGAPYLYRYDGGGAGEQRYVLSSYGADRRPGGSGDDADVTVRR